MKLYHYLSRDLVAPVQRAGLTEGRLVWPVAGGLRSYPFPCQWLTDDPDWSAQRWATQIGHHRDRTQARFVVKVPHTEQGKGRLVRWTSLARILKLPPDEVALFDASGGGTAVHWWCYLGHVPRGWLRGPEDRPAGLHQVVPPGFAFAEHAG